MIMQSTEGHASRVVEATEAVCSLPAIGTQDWCDRAAEALLRLFPRDLIALAILEVQPDGAVARVEAVGVAGADPRGDRVPTLRRRFDTAHHLGWSLGDPASWRAAAAARLADAAPRAWPTSDGSRQWASLGVTEVLAGAALLAPDDAARIIVAEVGRAEVGRLFDAAEEPAMLAATLGAVARRALLAFGTERISPARMLTPREQEVLEHLALGRSVKEIAARLSRSHHTVHDYVKALHRKLQASSRGALIAKALGHSMAEAGAERATSRRSNAG